VKVERVAFGELFELARRAVVPKPDAKYVEIGIRSFGKGIFIKESVTGLSLGSKRVFTVEAGDFVVSNVFGWEGAVGVAAAEHHGLIGSHRFMTWVARNDDINVGYVLEYFRSRIGVAALAAASPGSAGRNRTLSIKNLEKVTVPLPNREVQDRVVDHLAVLSRTDFTARHDGLAGLLANEWSGESYRLSDLVDLVVRSEEVIDDAEYELSGVRWYGKGLFVRETKLGKILSAKTVRRIEAGDLVYNRLFAWKRSFAIAKQDGWASNEFPTFRVNEEVVRPRVLLAALLGPTITDAVNVASTGSTPTSRNRLKEADFLRLKVDIPSIENQPAIERLLVLADEARALEEQSDALRRSLAMASRNEIFGSAFCQ
jgi:type I restriction enzyme S subunit